jgi:hypothetical protein
MDIVSLIKKKTKGLTTEQMQKSLQVFAECQNRLMLDLNSDEDKQTIATWIIKNPLALVPVVSLRADGIKEINDSIFTNETVRTFVFDFSFRFFSLCNESDNFLENLSCSIANGLILDDESFSIIPDAIRSSLVSDIFKNLTGRNKRFFKKNIQSEIVNFLKANKHLLIVFMICLTNNRDIK